MMYQRVSRSDNHPDMKKVIEYSFEIIDEYEDSPLGKKVILVPTLEDYHAVQGDLLIKGFRNYQVICLINPTDYKPPVGSVPYFLVTDDYTAHCDPWGNGCVYYFVKKDS